MKKIENLSDIQKLDADELKWLKHAVDQTIEYRAQPTVEEIELYYYDDGCEGGFFDVHDFQECARRKENEDDWDLIDSIEQDLNQAGSVTISKGKYLKESIGHEYFFGKDNPYEEDYNEDYE